MKCLPVSVCHEILSLRLLCTCSMISISPFSGQLSPVDQKAGQAPHPHGAVQVDSCINSLFLMCRVTYPLLHRAARAPGHIVAGFECVRYINKIKTSMYCRLCAKFAIPWSECRAVSDPVNVECRPVVHSHNSLSTRCNIRQMICKCCTPILVSRGNL
jgi:hypothetical protein